MIFLYTFAIETNLNYSKLQTLTIKQKYYDKEIQMHSMRIYP